MRSLTVALMMMCAACGLDSDDAALQQAVGELCMPEQVPEGGFSDNEAYVETSSVQCETQVCMAFKLQGDPRQICEETPGPECATRADVDAHVYCTCRCDGAANPASNCTCPNDFTCTPVLELGGPGVEGSYCVRD